MSRPRYNITLSIGDMCVTIKLKSCAGNHNDLQKELNQCIVKLAQLLERKHGGLPMVERKWNKKYSELVGHDHHHVSTGQDYWDIIKKEEQCNSGE